MIRIFSFTVLILVSGCTQGQSDKKIREKDVPEEVIIDLTVHKLSRLPQSLDEIPQCLKNDFDEFRQFELPNEFNDAELQYHDYYFDTVINNTHLAFAYHCIGGTNKAAIERRFLEELNRVYSDMHMTVQEERGACLYSIVSDSVVVENTAFKYIRYREFITGGASSFRSNEVFLISTKNLVDIVNSVTYSELNAFELLQYRREKNFF